MIKRQKKEKLNRMVFSCAPEIEKKLRNGAKKRNVSISYYIVSLIERV